MSAQLKESCYLYGVTAEEIDDWWPTIEPLLMLPLQRTGAIDDYHPEDILRLIKERSMQCWLGHKNGQVFAVGITQILIYPQRKVLGVPFVGSTGNDLEALVDYFEILQQYGESIGCKATRVWGRDGWKKVLGKKAKYYRIEFDIEV